MNTKESQLNVLLQSQDLVMVEWKDKYATGIELIDKQHRELIQLTNELYEACLQGNGTAREVFRDALRRVVDYTRYHFAVEEALLERIGFPVLACHRKQHETLIKEVLEAVKDYEGGRKFVPNVFVRTLKDWVLTHIALADKAYASYIADQKRRGLLTGAQLEGEERKPGAPSLQTP
jgi:hemerythrin